MKANACVNKKLFDYFSVFDMICWVAVFLMKIITFKLYCHYKWWREEDLYSQIKDIPSFGMNYSTILKSEKSQRKKESNLSRLNLDKSKMQECPMEREVAGPRGKSFQSQSKLRRNVLKSPFFRRIRRVDKVSQLPKTEEREFFQKCLQISQSGMKSSRNKDLFWKKL